MNVACWAGSSPWGRAVLVSVRGRLRFGLGSPLFRAWEFVFAGGEASYRTVGGFSGRLLGGAASWGRRSVGRVGGRRLFEAWLRPLGGGFSGSGMASGGRFLGLGDGSRGDQTIKRCSADDILESEGWRVKECPLLAKLN